MHINDPKHAYKLKVYQYHFLDDLSFVKRPQKVFIESSEEEIEAYIVAVRERFTEAGWEGDGDIGIIWVPPFVDIGIEDTWGTYIWHVKQSNNGTSWLASDAIINFKRIREQNESRLWATHVPVGLMYSPGEYLV